MAYSQYWIEARRAEIDSKNSRERLPANDVHTTAWHKFVPYTKG